jgi:hypothetical protein
MQLADVAPSFHLRPKLVADDLKRLGDPCVLFECYGEDSDGAPTFIYTVAGVLDGVPLADGATVGGEVIIIHADDREHADILATMGLQDTIDALHAEDGHLMDAAAALGRLGAVGPMGRLEAATKPTSDMNDDFIRDAAMIRPLIGDDIVLTTGSGPETAQ